MKVCPTCKRLYQTGLVVCPQDGGLLNTLREWQAGDTVSGKFSIVEKIGHGSLGPAFRAKVLPLGGIRALKCLSLRLADDEDLIKHFRQEVQVVSALRHLNAVHVESLERAPDGRPFIVMEYVSGLSLRELLSRGGYMPALDVVDIMAQVCAVLDSAHWQGIIHRNLKPDNVFIAEEDGSAPRVKVMELGMANLRQAAAERGKQVGDAVMTDHAIVVGTMEYMSPEQATAAPSRMVDGRSDLYSVGVMMFEALTGELPIATEDPMGLLRQKQEIAANELLCGTVLKALQRDPDYRYQSATEMMAALREVSHSLGKPRSENVMPAPGLEVARVSISTQNIPQILERTQDQPTTISAHHNTATPLPRTAVHRKPSSPSAVLRNEAATTDRTFDEIREAWLKRAGQTPSRQQGLGKHGRAKLLGAAFAVIFLLASWLVFRDRGVLTTGGKDPAGPVDWASPQVPARAATPEPRAQEVSPFPIESGPAKEQPTVMKQGPSLPLPLATVDANASPAPRAAGWQSGQQKAKPATADAPGNRRSGALTETAGSAAPASREAEIQKRIATGWLLVERGDHRAAMESFAEALKLDPSNVEAQAALRLARFAIQNPNVDVIPSPTPADGNRGKKGGS